MRTLRIGINASALAASKPATGVQRYLGALLTHLAARCEADDLSLSLYFTEPIPSATRESNPLLRELHPRRRLRWRIAPVARGWVRVGMGLAMQFDGLHLFHFPAPLMARYCPVPSVVTVHDLAALTLEPEQTQKERQYLDDAADAVGRATGLIAVSASAAEEVAHHFDRHDAAIIPEGVNLGQFRPASAEAVEAMRQRLGVERYILCVGTLQMRKNHIRLIEAFQQMQAQYPHTLVIAGGDGSGAEAVRAHLAANPDARVKLTGYLQDAALPALYSGADLMALPSLWEGFGLPLLEAMACETPVLTSNLSSLAEVAAGAAELVDPRSTESIRHGLQVLLNNPGRRQALIAAGRERAARYSWAETARRTAAFYRRVAEKHAHSPR